MILVSVQNAGDVQLARALIQAFGKRFEWFLLFSGPELKQRMGEVEYKYGFDAPFCMLNAANFQLVVSFAGLLHPGLMRNVLLLSFFNEIGVATLEIQHGLFQYGINNVDMAPQVGADIGRGDQLGINIGYAARDVVPWAGPEGIGYPKSILTPRPCSRRNGFVLITSNNHWQVYKGPDRQQFGMAVTKLVESRPDLEFVWKPHHGEFLTHETKQVLDTIQQLKLPNLQIESAGDAEDLIPSCAFGVSTVSTTLLDYQMQSKPVLVYDRDPVRHLIARMQVKTFQGAPDLLEKVGLLPTDPERHLIHTGVEPFVPERLARRFEQALSVAAPPHNHLPVTLKYLEYLRMQRPVAQPEDVDRAVVHITQDVARMAGKFTQNVTRAEATLVEALGRVAGEIRQDTAQGAANLAQDITSLTRGIKHVSRKLGELQRSTLAYKLKKAFKGSPTR